MARTAINVIAPARNSKADDAVTAIDVANGMYIPALPTRDIIVRVKNTFAGAKSVTFKAGVNPPAGSAGHGDLTQSMDQDAVMFFHLESARFAQADGKINVDFTAAMTGEISVIRKLRT